MCSPRGLVVVSQVPAATSVRGGPSAVSAARESADPAAVSRHEIAPAECGKSIGMEGAVVSHSRKRVEGMTRWVNSDITRKETNHVANGSAVPDYRHRGRRSGPVGSGVALDGP